MFLSGSLTQSKFLNPASLIHGSILVPPQLVLIRPTGMPSDLFSIRPKKYAVALNSLTFSGSQSFHDPSKSSSGVKLVTLGTVISLTDGLDDVTMYSSEPVMG